MKNFKKKIGEIKKYLSKGEIKKAQEHIEELQKQVILIDRLNSDWGTWRCDENLKEKIELEFELKQLEMKTPVIQKNFDDNINFLKELAK